MNKRQQKKSKRIERLEEEKEEITKLINSIKEDNSNIVSDDVQILEQMLEAICKKEKENMFVSFLKSSLEFVIQLAIKYVIVLLVFGIFFACLKLDNKYNIFILALIISFLLHSISLIPILSSITKTTKNAILLKLGLKIGVIIAFMILNKYYIVFEFSTIWIYFIVLTDILFLIYGYYITKLSYRR